MENVVLVDEQDNEVGIEEKLQVHLSGKLHRAVSVFLFNKRGELLIQQRAYSKYHSGGLWSNTCCGHPRPGEAPLQASKRRLREEMGIHCERHIQAQSYSFRGELAELSVFLDAEERLPFTDEELPPFQGEVLQLEKLFHFVYKISLDNKITEYEFDHVFVGQFDGKVTPDPQEVCAWKWIEISKVEKEISCFPERYTYWFKLIWQEVVNQIV